MSATPIRVAVLAHDGTLLGWVTRKPTGPTWRALGNLPRVILNNHAKAWPKTRECNPYGRGWAVRLYDGEPPPPRMEKLTAA